MDFKLLALKEKVILALVALAILVGVAAVIYYGQPNDMVEPVEITDEQRAKIESEIADIQVKVETCDESSDDNKCSSLYLQLAIQFQSLGRISDAIRANVEAANANSSSYIPYSNLGSIYVHIKQFDKAEVALKKAISIEPNNLSVYTKLFELYFYEQKKPPNEIQPFFVQAVTDTKGDLNMVRLYAFYAEQINDPVTAIELWKIILTKEPDNQAAKDKIAKLEQSAREQGLIE